MTELTKKTTGFLSVVFYVRSCLANSPKVWYNI